MCAIVELIATLSSSILKVCAISEYSLFWEKHVYLKCGVSLEQPLVTRVYTAS